MRIGMFADMYLPHVSGVTNHIRLYKEELERQGHDVTVFTFGNRDYADAEDGVVRSPALPYGDTGWNVPLGVGSGARRAMATLDIAHAHHPFASCLTALSVCGSAGTPVVFTNHTRYDLYSDAYAAWIPRSLRHTSIQRYLTWLGERVSLTLSPSAEVAQWLASYRTSTENLLEFPNAIDVARFARPSEPLSKADLGITDDAFAFCYVGRIAPEKNVSLLLDAFEQAASRDPKIALVLLGDGPERAGCEARIEESGLGARVRFLGMRPYETVPGVLAAADAFVTASVSEMYPLVVVEACAAGLPVVGVQSPGVGEIVSTGTSGLLTAEDATDLADAMVALSLDARLSSRLSGGAREVADAHEIGASTRRLLDLYADLMANSHRD